MLYCNLQRLVSVRVRYLNILAKDKALGWLIELFCMKFTMNKLLLVFALLFSQMSFAVHDTHWMDDAPETVCMVCVSIDHSDIIGIAEPLTQFTGASEITTWTSIQPGLFRSTQVYSSRAPPLTS